MLNRVFSGLFLLLGHLGVLLLVGFGVIEWGTGLVFTEGQSVLEAEFVTVSEDTVLEVVSEGVVVLTEVERSELVEVIVNADSIEELESVLADAELDLSSIKDAVPLVGSASGVLRVGSIGLESFLVEGVGVSDLRKGPGVFASSPSAGSVGNFAVAGHRTTFGAPFNKLNEVSAGDVIEVVDEFSFVHTYVVEDQGGGRGWFVVKPWDTWVVGVSGDDSSVLTLVACHPKRSAAQRIVVRAVLVSSVDESVLLEGLDEAARLRVIAEREAGLEVIQAVEAKLVELRAVAPVLVEMSLPSEFVSEVVGGGVVSEIVVDGEVGFVGSEALVGWVDGTVDWGWMILFSVAAVLLWGAAGVVWFDSVSLNLGAVSLVSRVGSGGLWVLGLVLFGFGLFGIVGLFGV